MKYFSFFPKVSILPLGIVFLLASVFLYAGGESEGEGTRTLVFATNASDPAPKAAWEKVVALFEEAHPDIDVQVNTFDHEAYKVNIRNFLSSESPDLALWFAGNRMKFFVDQGLLEDISDVWADNGLADAMSSSLSALTVDGKQYGVPVSYYQWGVYYRSDIFAQYGIGVPRTWDEFLAASKTLKDNGVTPITIGTKYLWTAAGWFDYLNLRINGIDYHLDLAAGNIPYTDSRLDAVFDAWKELLEPEYFLENHASYSWQEAQAPLINGDAAMYLIGNFIVPDLETAGVVDNIGFFQFPAINSSVGTYEDAPIETIHIPVNAKNKEDARTFLAFVANPEVNSIIAHEAGQLAPHADAPTPTNRFLVTGFEMLSNADGIAQFYDRDTSPEMASIGMEGFQEFMVFPDREDEIRERLEEARKNIFQ